MTKKEIRTSVSSSCKKVMKSNGFGYKDIEFNYGLPWIAIFGFFFDQGDEAQNLIDQMKETSQKTGLHISTCLVWYLDSAGVFSQPRNTLM
jgi:hypothetical protein